MVYKNNGKTNKNIVYPIFLECAKLASDDYWKTLYENMAKDKYPKMIYIKNCTVKSVNKKHDFSYCFKDKTAQEISVELYDILTKHTLILSSNDKLKKKEDEEKTMKEIQMETYEDWKDIKKKKIKSQLIDDYCVNMEQEYKLSEANTRELRKMINKGFLFKNIESCDVEFSDGKILSIEGIEYEPSKKCFVNKQKFKRENLKIEPTIQHCLYFTWSDTIKTMFDSVGKSKKSSENKE